MVSLHTTEKESHICLPLHARPMATKPPFRSENHAFFCVESLKRKKNRNGLENLVSSGAARLSNNLLHGLNLGLAAAESTELDMKLAKVLTQMNRLVELWS